ncbi:gluconeogenesis factor YvcK family protein, partial [Nitrolancea hollandica]|uniref:gluconeogenesis factor YvcK family protein n=1 Tax=Nitrolancea hollandica TaxID=1206749 RepID=UPI00059157A5
PPPGDIRNCIVALADVEPLMGDLFQYRFEQEGSALDGHSFGNLFITAMTQVSGSFEQAIVESSRVLAVRGNVVPSSLENITVCGEMADGRIIRGESRIVAERAKIQRVFLDPPHPAAYDPAIVAILSADLIVLGPGSLYTSVLPNLLVQGITHAIRCSTATKVYVCNVATQRGETDNFGVADHFRALHKHMDGPIVDHVLVNSNLGPASTKIKPEWSVNAVDPEGVAELEGIAHVVLRDVVNPDFPLRHDPEKLAAALLDLAREERAISRNGSNALSYSSQVAD